MPIRLNAIIMNRRDLASVWASKNPLLGQGEIGIELDTDRIKKGPGRWNDLDYYISEATVTAMIAASSGGDITALVAELADDGHPEGIVAGQSFELIYENRKV